MLLYRTAHGAIARVDDTYFSLGEIAWDVLLNSDNLIETVQQLIATATRLDEAPLATDLLAPLHNQEVWAAGVTYYRSRDARMEESKTAGGEDFYARVYEAERPELFFKAPPYRVVGPHAPVRIRRDAHWNVPEPELTLVINAHGEIVGYTIGNDMSSRDIEGENPLYLPQAKVYDGACAVGPAILVTSEMLPAETPILLTIYRGTETDIAFHGETTLAQLKRTPTELVSYLFRETSFPYGAFLLTGTGIIPQNDFTLQSGDEIHITIPPIGTLVNTVA